MLLTHSATPTESGSLSVSTLRIPRIEGEIIENPDVSSGPSGYTNVLIKVWRQLLTVGILIAILLGFSPQQSFATNQLKKNSLSLAHYTMGLIYDYQDSVAKAIEEYQKALEFDFTNSLLHLRLGIDYTKIGKLNQAISEFKLASKFNTEDLESRYLLAILYTSLKRFDEATPQYEIILKKFSERTPKDVQVFNHLGQLYFYQKRFDEAINQFKAILILEPKNVEALFYLGSLSEEKGSRKQAIEFFKKAIEINPQHADSLNSLGYLYAEEGSHLEEAVSLVNRALKINPENSAYIDSLGWAYFKKGMLTEAVAELEKASHGLEDPEILKHLGEAYLKTSEKEKAKKAWLRALELNPQQAELKIKLKNLEKAKPVSSSK